MEIKYTWVFFYDSGPDTYAKEKKDAAIYESAFYPVHCGDYDAIRQYHKENGWVCFENTAMGLYFINDPDDYWIEILPAK